MIDDQGAASEIEIRLCQGHHAVGRCFDRRAGGGGDINSIMWLAGFAVQNALAAEYAADPSFDRPGKAAEEISRVDIPAARLLQLCFLPLDALHHLRWRSHFLLR